MNYMRKLKSIPKKEKEDPNVINVYSHWFILKKYRNRGRKMMTEFEKQYYKSWISIMQDPAVIADLIKLKIKKFDKYTLEELTSFIHDITIHNTKKRYQKPKSTYDLSCNLDIPDEGRLKVFIFIYVMEKEDDINFLTFINQCMLQKELNNSTEDEGYNVIGFFPIWIVDNQRPN